MIESMKPIEVKYIGKRQPWFDRLYDTGLSFVCGQSRVLPWDMAPKFLRHSDLFEKVEQSSAKPPADDDKKDSKPPADDKNAKDKGDKDEAPKDDTQALLDEQAAKNKEKDDEQAEKQALYDQVANMDKDGLKDFAEINYQQKINKSKSLENLRAEVTGMIDQFGVV